MKIAIRDDDANRFTNYQDIDFVYSKLNGFPISLAIVPFVTGDNGDCPESKNKYDNLYLLGENLELVEYLKKGCKEGEIEVLLHGITHEYKKRKGIRIPEMIWKNSFDCLFDELSRGKCYLESLLDIKINIFVAPSNKICKNGIRAVVENDMNYSGIISFNDRNFSLVCIGNLLKRWFFRFNMGIQYPGVLDYGSHLELNACCIYSYDYLMKVYKVCKKYNFPMVLNTHYWHLRDNPEINDFVVKFIEFAIEDGAEPCFVSQCYK